MYVRCVGIIIYLIYFYSSRLYNLSCSQSVRVLPHHQDTGGFFIAVLNKSDWLPWQRRPRHTADPSPSSSSGGGVGEGTERPSVLGAKERGEEREGVCEGGREAGVLAGGAEGQPSEGEKAGGVAAEVSDGGRKEGEGEGGKDSGAMESSPSTSRPSTTILGRYIL